MSLRGIMLCLDADLVLRFFGNRGEHALDLIAAFGTGQGEQS